MNNRELIYSLIRLSLAEAEDGFEVFEGVTVQQWHWAFGVLSLHGLAV